MPLFLFKRYSTIDAGISAESLQFTSAFADELGRFEVKALHPGRYLVGVGIQGQPNSAEWRSRVYYPGVRDLNLAVIIDLGRAEKRTGVDFQLPPINVEEKSNR
jgi:hypothetical protein